MLTIAFAGNPNVGKTALINAISGAKLKVGNWSGVTVERKEAEFEYKGEKIKIIDLPGVYSLSSYTVEERITRDYILEESPDIIINVVDSTNLERNLYLTMLLKEMGKPMLMAFNFIDEFEKLDYKIDLEGLSNFLEMNVVKTSAIRNKGINELLEEAILVTKNNKKQKHIRYEASFEKVIETEIKKVSGKLENIKEIEKLKETYTVEWMAIKLLEKDTYFAKKIKEEKNIDLLKIFQGDIEILEKKFDEDSETVLAEGRYAAINGVLKKTLKKSLRKRLDFTDKIDDIFLHKIFGIPLFFTLIYLMFVFTFEGSAPFIDWVDGFIADYIGKYIGIFVEGTPAWLNSLIMDGIVGGVGGVLVFVPLMLFLYLFLALLEESGYMSRVAFLMDKGMRKLGLNGKAFVPLILGFGCSVPSIYATRTLEDEKTRKVTALLAPLMSCGARLPVYALFTAAFFKKNANLVVFSMYLIGMLVAVTLAFIMKNLKSFKKDETELLIELPPYRFPTFKMLWNSVITRTMAYVKNAGTIILGMMIILWVFMYFPNQGDKETSYLGKTAKFIQPMFAPTGFGDSWEAVASIVPGLVAKEVVVGFMGQVLLEEIEEEKKEEKTNFLQDTGSQLKALIFAIKDSIAGIFTLKTTAFSPPSEEELEKGGKGVIKAVGNLWTDKKAPLRAFSFMVFILLVVPCVVTLAAIKQEFGIKLMLIEIALLTIVPYIVSTLIYQIGSVLLY